MHVKNTLTKKIQGLDAFEEIYAWIKKEILE